MTRYSSLDYSSYVTRLTHIGLVQHSDTLLLYDLFARGDSLSVIGMLCLSGSILPFGLLSQCDTFP